MEFRAYGFLGESVTTRQDWDGGMFKCVLMSEYGTNVVTSLILKLFSAGDAFVSLHSAERTVLFAVFATKRAGFYVFLNCAIIIYCFSS
jgi:hypothetical protein